MGAAAGFGSGSHREQNHPDFRPTRQSMQNDFEHAVQVSSPVITSG